MERRDYIAIATGSLAAFAGCSALTDGLSIGSQDGTGPESPTPTDAGDTASSQSVAVPDGWSMVRGDHSARGRISDASGVETPLTESWRRSFDAPVVTRLAATDGRVYAGLDAGSGTLVAVDAATGDETWRVELPATPTTEPVAAGGLVVIGTADGGASVLATDGTVRWTANDGDLGPRATAITSRHVLVSYPRRGGTAYDHDGNEQYGFVTNGVPVVRGADSRLYYGGSAYALASGRKQWSLELFPATVYNSAVAGDLAVVGYAATSTPPGRQEDTPAPGTGAGMVCVDAASGERRWYVGATPNPGTTGVPLTLDPDRDRAYYGRKAYRLRDGEQVWRIGDRARTVFDGPAVTERELYVGAGDELAAIDPSTGEVDQSLVVAPGAPDRGERLVGAPVAGDGQVFAAAHTELVAYAPRR